MTYEELVARKNEICNSQLWGNERERALNKIIAQAHRELAVGDGVTLRLWSDAHAYTVIKRTPCTITVQRDKATLDPNFKPEFIVGGFAAHCTNQEDQRYTYERNPEGEKLTLHWSNKWERFMYCDRAIYIGRDEFYDYNF